ncbi:MAG: hypothetical protein LBT83_01135 [Tannerella sp.]|nr:hypothetical protein [Tannerella sp.]
MEAIKDKIPEKSSIANVLADILSIKKEALYRRLRGEVFFTFAEIVTISQQLNISLDRVAGSVSPYRSHLFQLHVQDYFDTNEVDYKMTADYIAVIKAAGQEPFSEYGFATTTIPLHFSLFHKSIYCLYILKWMYQFGDIGKIRPYSEIVFTERQKKLNHQYLQEVMSIKYTYYIWGEYFLVYLINDIKYFHCIRLISTDEVLLLRKEIAYFLDHMEKMAIQGAYANGNKVEIFVSSLNFETTYHYLSSENIHISMISSFAIGAVTSLEKEVCDKLKIWMQALKRTSTLISCSAEKERILFFEKQRNILKESFDC